MLVFIMLYMKKYKMQSQNKYIGDDKFQNLIDHYKCNIPLDVIKLRFAGAICSPNLDLRPTDVISSFWQQGHEPRLETKEEADLFFKFFMGLWDDILSQIKSNNIKLPRYNKLDKDSLNLLCNQRFEQIEYGYVEGFWGGKSDLKIPAYIVELLNSLSDLAKLYQSLASRALIENNINNLVDTVKHTDKVTNRTIAFLIENTVLPRIEA